MTIASQYANYAFNYTGTWAAYQTDPNRITAATLSAPGNLPADLQAFFAVWLQVNNATSTTGYEDNRAKILSGLLGYLNSLQLTNLSITTSPTNATSSYLAMLISRASISTLSTSIINNLSATVWSQITPQAFARFGGLSLQGLAANKIQALTQQQVQELTAAQISAMNNGDFFNNLTQTQISSYITANNQHIFWPLSQMNSQVVSQLSADFFNKLSGSQMFWINSPFLNCVNTTVLASVNQSVRTGIPPENFDTLSTDRQAIIYTADYYNNLSPEVASRVSYTHIVAMNVTTIARLNASFLNALSTTVIAQFTLSFFNNLPVAAINGLNANFVNNISNALIRVIGADWTAGARFLNALSQNANSTAGNVVAQLDPIRFIGPLNDWPIKAAVWTELSAGFFNAMSPTTVTNYIGYGALNCIRDATIPSLSVGFLNAINAGSVGLMISNDWNGYARPNRSFALNIPTNKWLSLDGTKYKGLIIGLSAANINSYTAADFAGIRADALNALANPAAGTFLPSESGRQIIQAISPTALSTILANLSPSNLDGGVAAFLNALSCIQVSGGTANGANYVQMPSAILNTIASSANGRVTIPSLSDTFLSNLAASMMSRGTIAHLNADFFTAMTTAQKNNVGANFLNGLVAGTAFDGAINFLQSLTADYLNNWATTHTNEIATLNSLFLSQLSTSVISELNANFINNLSNVSQLDLRFLGAISNTVVPNLNNNFIAGITDLKTIAQLGGNWITKFPQVIYVSANQTLAKTDTLVNFTLALSQTVTVTQGTNLNLSFSNGGVANYVSGSGSNTLVFQYRVLAGQDTTSLRIIDFNINGATVKNTAGVSLNFNQNYKSAWVVGADLEKLATALTIDTTAPLVSIITNNSTLRIGGTTFIKFGLSEASTNFGLDDVSVSGGTLTNFTGSGADYNATFTATSTTASAASIYVLANKFTDAAGNNNNTASSTLSIAIDAIAPTISISTNTTLLRIGSTALITFNLSESAADFAINDVSLTNGTLSGFAGSGTRYTAIFTPATGLNASANIYVSGTKFTDAVGNNNTASSTLSILLDTLAPTLSIATSNSTLRIGSTALITFNLSETTTNFTIDDISFIGGTLSYFTGSMASYTAIFTPTNLRTLPGSIYVLGAKFTDSVGNNNIASSTLSILVDTVAPGRITSPITIDATNNLISANTLANGVVAHINLANTNAIAGDSIELLINNLPFSRPVTYLISNNDIVNNLVNVTIPANAGWSGDGDKILSARITDAAGNIGESDGTITVTLDTNVTGTPTKLFIPALSNGITPDEITSGINIIVDLTGTTISAGRQVEILLNGNQFNTPIKVTLTDADVLANKVFITIDASSDIANLLANTNNPVFTARVIARSGTLGAAGGNTITVINDEISSQWFNQLSNANLEKLQKSMIQALPMHLFSNNLLLELGRRLSLNLENFYFTEDQFLNLSAGQINILLTHVNTISADFINALSEPQIIRNKNVVLTRLPIDQIDKLGSIAVVYLMRNIQNILPFNTTQIQGLNASQLRAIFKDYYGDESSAHTLLPSTFVSSLTDNQKSAIPNNIWQAITPHTDIVRRPRHLNLNDDMNDQISDFKNANGRAEKEEDSWFSTRASRDSYRDDATDEMRLLSLLISMNGFNGLSTDTLNELIDIFNDSNKYSHMTDPTEVRQSYKNTFISAISTITNLSTLDADVRTTLLSIAGTTMHANARLDLILTGDQFNQLTSYADLDAFFTPWLNLIGDFVSIGGASSLSSAILSALSRSQLATLQRNFKYDNFMDASLSANYQQALWDNPFYAIRIRKIVFLTSNTKSNGSAIMTRDMFASMRSSSQIINFFHPWLNATLPADRVAPTSVLNILPAQQIIDLGSHLATILSYVGNIILPAEFFNALTVLQLHSINDDLLKYNLTDGHASGFSADYLKNTAPLIAHKITTGTLNYTFFNALSAVTIASLNSNFFDYILSAIPTGNTLLGHLNDLFFQSISANAIQNFSNDNLKKLQPYLSKMSADGLLNLSNEQSAGVTFPTTAKPISQLSTEQLGGLTVAQIQKISASVLAELSTEKLSALNKDVLLNLTAKQLSILSNDQIKSVIAKQVPVLFMNYAEINSLTNQQIEQITPDTIAALAPQQFSALSITQIAHLSTAQMRVISYEVLAQLSPEKLRSLSQEQLLSIAPETLGMLDNQLRRYLQTIDTIDTAHHWSPEQINSLTRLNRANNVDFSGDLLFDLIKDSRLASRNLFITASISRELIEAKHLNISTVNVQNNNLSTRDFFINAYRRSDYSHRDYTNKLRSMYQGIRLIGSALQFAGAINLFYQSSDPTNTSLERTSDLWQGMAWIASSLKAPNALVYSIYEHFSKNYTNLKNTGVGTASAWLQSAWTATTRSFPEVTGFTAMKEFFSFRTELANGVDIQNPLRLSAAPNTTNIRPRLINVVPGPSSAPNGVVADRLNTLIRRSSSENTNTDSARNGWANGAMINLISNTLGVVSASYRIAVARQVEDSAESTTQIIFSTLQLVGSAINLGAQLSPEIFERSIQNLRRNSVALRIGNIITFIAINGYDVVESFLRLRNDNSDLAKGTAIFSVLNAGINTALLVLSTTVGGLASVFITLVSGLLLPNWSAGLQLMEIQDKKSLLKRQGRTIEADYVYNALEQLAKIAATPLLALTYSAESRSILDQLKRDMNEIVAPNQSRLSQALAQDYFYAVESSEEGIDLTMILRSYITNSAASNQKIISARIISGETVLARDYYADTPDKDTIHNYILDLKISNTALMHNIVTGWDAGTITLENLSTNDDQYELVKVFTGDDYGYLTLTEIEEDDDDTGRIPLILDASATTTNRMYSVTSDNVFIRGGTGINQYFIDAEQVRSTNYHISATDRSKNEVFVTANDTSTVRINLNNITNANVSSFAGITIATGSIAMQSLFARSAKNNITMTGGQGALTIGGRGNRVLMGGGGNLANVILGWHLIDGVGDDHLGNIDGGAYTGTGAIPFALYNRINFSAATQGVDIAISASVAGASIFDTNNHVIDAVSFTNFQEIIGSNLNDTIDINHRSDIFMLSLGIGNNTVNLRDVTNLNIYTNAGVNDIFIDGRVLTSQVYIHTTRGEDNIILGNNSNITAVLGGLLDIVDFTYSDTADFSYIQTDAGFHKILLNQFCTGSIEMIPNVANNHTVVYEDTAQRAVGDEIILSLSSSITASFIDYDSNNKIIRVYSNDGSNNELDFYAQPHTTVNASSGATQLTSSNVYLNMFNDSADDNKMYQVDTSALIQAMQVLGDAHKTDFTYKGQTTHAFTLASVFTQIHAQA